MYLSQHRWFQRFLHSPQKWDYENGALIDLHIFGKISKATAPPMTSFQCVHPPETNNGKTVENLQQDPINLMVQTMASGWLLRQQTNPCSNELISLSYCAYCFEDAVPKNWITAIPMKNHHDCTIQHQSTITSGF